MAWRDWIRTVEIEPVVITRDLSALRHQADTLLRAGCRIFGIDGAEPATALAVVRLLAPEVCKYDGGVLDVRLHDGGDGLSFASFAEAGASSVTVQLEATADVPATFAAARAQGLAVGLAFAQGTAVELAAELGASADLVRCPGRGALDRPRLVRLLARALPANVPIQVGGGITYESARELYEAGARVLLVGDAIFGREDLPRAYRRLVQALA